MLKPKFYLSFSDKFCLEGDKLVVFGKHSVGHLGDLNGIVRFLELQSLESIEAVTNKLTDLRWVLSVGEDGK